MPSPAGIAELLSDLSTGLSTLGVSWYVFGAQAVLLWGRPRFTSDVDITVHLGAHDTQALIDALAPHGFALRLIATPEFVRHTRVLPFVHQRSGVALDAVIGGPGLEEAFASRAIGVKVADGVVPVISPEDLVVTKALAGRPKDIDDLQGILFERADRLDAAYIRQTLDSLEAALGQSDLLPIFEREWVAATTRRGR